MQTNLQDLLAPIRVLNNIADITATKLKSIGIERVIDLLFYFPTNVIIRHFCKNARDLKIKEHCIIKLRVVDYQKTLKTTKVICEDFNGEIIYINFFRLYKNYLEKNLPLGKQIIIVGIPEIYNNNYTFNHPSIILNDALFDSMRSMEVVYRQHHEITSNKFSNFITQALNILNSCVIEEWLDKNYLKEQNLPSFKEAINSIHSPKSINDISLGGKNMIRLALDEMVAYHFNLLEVRNNKVSHSNIIFKPNNSLNSSLLKNLTFKLTNDQISAISNIKEEFMQSKQSSVLLQGDVGSGKTIVCFIVALMAIESGYQAAFMVPTEILANQHYNTFLQYVEILGIKIALLKSKEKVSVKKQLLQSIANKEIDLVVGTHSLFQAKVEFAKLGLVIIDEQHRFGVEQRMQLLNKGDNPKLILTTATPIPRSLALSLYGDIKYFDIKEKPKNRKPITTYTVSKSRIIDLMNSIIKKLEENEKIYWVCPLVDVSEKLLLQASVERYNSLLDNFPLYKDLLFLLHGKMDFNEKETVLSNFKNSHKGGILVATTVIEVGVDIPDCNIIIIENPEHFGLAQLHQLRGRVGRSDVQGVCILLYSDNITLTAKKRLETIKNSNDGFYIAEKDLEIRGYGDILGTMQSGMDFFKIINLEYHGKYMHASLQQAKLLFQCQNTERNLKTLQYIFNYDNKDKYIKS